MRPAVGRLILPGRTPQVEKHRRTDPKHIGPHVRGDRTDEAAYFDLDSRGIT
jgi:hypothetical protein